MTEQRGQGCWCGSGMMMIFRVLVGGRTYKSCPRCSRWRLLQVAGIWDTIAVEGLVVEKEEA